MASQLQQPDRFINDRSHYQDCVVKLDKCIKGSEETKNRYVAIQSRKAESVYSMDNIKNISFGKYKTSWCGITMMKGPMDMVIMQQMIWREKPATIIEIGAYTGGSAIWMSDVAKLAGIQCHVYSMDINISMVDCRARANKSVTFIEGDAQKIGDSFTVEMMEKLPHPWVITEDAHVDVVGCMEYFHKYMQEGDYFIIEDTNPDMPSISGQGLLEELGYETWGLQKHSLMKQFIESHPENYAVDTYYADFFGYNGSCNWNGYIRRIK